MAAWLEQREEMGGLDVVIGHDLRTTLPDPARTRFAVWLGSQWRWKQGKFGSAVCTVAYRVAQITVRSPSQRAVRRVRYRLHFPLNGAAVPNG